MIISRLTGWDFEIHFHKLMVTVREAKGRLNTAGQSSTMSQVRIRKLNVIPFGAVDFF